MNDCTGYAIAFKAVNKVSKNILKTILSSKQDVYWGEQIRSDNWRKKSKAILEI